MDTAAHGRDGLEVLALGPDRYDVVLMDLDMPIMDGFAATASARARGYEVPIVALSAHSLSADRAKSLELGWDDFLAKPVSAERLVATCARHCGRPLVAAEPPPLSLPEAPEPSGLAPARSKWAGDPEFADLLEAYHLSMSGMREDLEAARAAADLARARTLTHRLRGSAGQYGYPDLSEAAAACEKLLLEGKTVEEIETELAALLVEISRVAQNA